MTLALFEDDAPRARLTDPITSHKAADVNDTAGSRRAVLLILQAYGRPLADFQIEQIHNDAGGKYTGQRLRSARAELVERGSVVHDSETVSPKDTACWTWRLRRDGDPPVTDELTRQRARRSRVNPKGTE